MGLEICIRETKRVFFGEVPELVSDFNCDNIVDVCVGSKCSTCPFSEENIKGTVIALTKDSD